MDELKSMQSDMRKRFYRNVAAIPEGAANVAEEVAGSPEESDWGELLVLRVIPSTSDYCPVTVVIGGAYCQIHAGKCAEFEWNPHLDSDVSRYPLSADRVLIAVLTGGCSEVEVRLGRIRFLSFTRVRMGSQVMDSTSPLGSWLVKMLQCLAPQSVCEWHYRPYFDGTGSRDPVP